MRSRNQLNRRVAAGSPSVVGSKRLVPKRCVRQPTSDANQTDGTDQLLSSPPRKAGPRVGSAGSAAPCSNQLQTLIARFRGHDGKSSPDQTPNVKFKPLAVIAMKVVHPGKPGQAVDWKTYSEGRVIARMNVHKNARLTRAGRPLLVEGVEKGWPMASAAAAARISRRRGYHWLARYRTGGGADLADRSSAPQRRHHRLRPSG